MRAMFGVSLTDLKLVLDLIQILCLNEAFQELAKACSMCCYGHSDNNGYL